MLLRNWVALGPVIHKSLNSLFAKLDEEIMALLILPAPKSSSISLLGSVNNTIPNVVTNCSKGMFSFSKVICNEVQLLQLKSVASWISFGHADASESNISRASKINSSSLNLNTFNDCIIVIVDIPLLSGLLNVVFNVVIILSGVVVLSNVSSSAMSAHC